MYDVGEVDVDDVDDADEKCHVDEDVNGVCDV